IGYTAQAVDFSNYAFTTKTVEIDKIVLEVMASLVAGPELAVLATMTIKFCDMSTSVPELHVHVNEVLVSSHDKVAERGRGAGVAGFPAVAHHAPGAPGT
ncbi:hypothetical protein ACFQ1S_30350, partial [Kibdelosporangium lantanae]